METLLETVDHRGPELFALNCSSGEIVKKLDGVIEDNTIIGSHHGLPLVMHSEGSYL